MTRPSSPPPEVPAPETTETTAPRAEQLPASSAGAAPPPGGKRPLPPPPAPPRPAARPIGAPAAAPVASVERVAAKQTFAPDEPLPAFTYPVLDEDKKQELLRRVEEARAQPQSSVDRVAAKETFAPDEPLPAFTYPVLDEDKKLELLRRVEEANAAAADAGTPRTAEAVAPTPTVKPPPDRSTRRFDAAKLLSELGRIARRVWARSSEVVRRSIDAACTVIDQNRSRLPARLRDPLSKVRAGVILAVLAMLAFMVGGLLFVVGGGGEQAEPKQVAPAPPPPPKVDPVPRELEEAKKQGHSALEKLAERYPKDHRVWLELASSHSAKEDLAAAVAAIGKAVAADPKANEQAAASDMLALAVRNRQTTDAALELLQGPMGAAGATVLYDLTADPKVPLPLRTRAEEWIKSEAFRKVASPDVEIAGALRYAKSCSERHDILPRAAEKGGQRVLDYLKIMKSGGGCGRGGKKDCFPCMRKDSALKDALSAVEKRVGAK